MWCHLRANCHFEHWVERLFAVVLWNRFSFIQTMMTCCLKISRGKTHHHVLFVSMLCNQCKSWTELEPKQVIMLVWKSSAASGIPAPPPAPPTARKGYNTPMWDTNVLNTCLDHMCDDLSNGLHLEVSEALLPAVFLLQFQKLRCVRH